MRSEGRILPKATPAMAQRVWARQQRPSARNVARALTLAGKPVHYVTVARWKRQNWRPVRSDHPLEVARSQIEAVAPLVTGDPETRLTTSLVCPKERTSINRPTASFFGKQHESLRSQPRSSRRRSKAGPPQPLNLVRSGAISFSDTAAKWYAGRGRATSQCLAKLVSGGDGRRGRASDFPPFVP